jgi:hypothetical protein
MTLRVFASGQSNAMGRGTGGRSWANLSPDVRLWNNLNPLGGIGNAFVSPVEARTNGSFGYTDRNNAFVWFCDKLARTHFEPVDLTFVGRGGSSITLWGPNETEFPMLQECVRVWAATGQAPADVFLWHQGENNTGWTAQDYRAEFDALLDNVTAGGVIDANTVVIVGGTAEENAGRLAFNRNVLARHRRAAYATSYGLSTSDGTHFDGPSLTKLGAKRYFSAYLFAKMRSA